MAAYAQLTYEQRCQILALLQASLKKSQIAKELGCSQSTISREVKRNSGHRGYRYKQAQRFTTERPDVIETRNRIGDWEIDLMIDKAFGCDVYFSDPYSARQ